MNSLVIVFGLLLCLMVSINGLTPVPTPPPSADGSVLSTAPTLKPTSDDGIVPTPKPSSGPTPAPVSGGSAFTPAPTLRPTSADGIVPSPKPSPGPTPGPTPTPVSGGSVLSTAPTLRPTSNIGIVPTPRPSGGPTPSPENVSMKPTSSPINGVLSRCVASTDSTLLDVIFMVDSSGSVYDSDYKNWENELDLVYDIIDNVLPINSRVGLINFSGCGTGFTLEECRAQNRLNKMISLKDNGSPNDLNTVLSIVEAIGEEDFNGGYTWTNEALTMALEEFLVSMDGQIQSNKMIILISDGEPYPVGQDHEACKSSTNYVSPTLTSLRELGVDIITVGIDITQDIKEEYFDCISGGDVDFYFDATFDSSSFAPTSMLSGLTTPPTQDGLSVPSPLPTPSPNTGTGISPGTAPTPPPTLDGSSLSPVPTKANGSPSGLPTPSPTPAPVSASASGTVPTPPPTLDGSGLSPAPTKANGSPSQLPTPSPNASTGSSPGTVPTPPPTLDGSSLSPAPTKANGSPSQLPTPSPNASAGSSPGTVPTPPPTLDGSASPLPTPSPSASTGSSPGAAPTPPPTPSLDGSVSPLPTPSPTPAPVSPGTVPTPPPTRDGSGLSPVPTASIVAVEDLSDSIGDFICSELGLTRMIIPTVKPTPMPTSIIEPSPKPTTEPTLGNLQGKCSSTNALDIIFMVDSSGSVYDDEYNNWQSELDLVNEIIQSLPEEKTRTSLINFSGCGSSFTLEQCQAQGRLDVVFGLDGYGAPNDLELVSTRIESMTSDDFNGGYTWTNEALGLALDQFNLYSDATTNKKVIVLLTDGEPYPYDEGHEPCLTSTDYKSPVLTLLDNLGVDIVTIGIDISSTIKDEKLDCISSSYFGVSQFLTLESLSVEIGELICDKIDGSFKTMSLAPSMKPTSYSYSNIPSSVPTPSPVIAFPSMGPTISDKHATSNGIMAKIYINYLVIISGFIAYLLF